MPGPTSALAMLAIRSPPSPPNILRVNKIPGAFMILTFAMVSSNAQTVSSPAVLKADDFKPYIDTFNRNDDEVYREVESVRNDQAWDFLKEQIPLLDCPDKNLEEIYYFRWWTYRKHIKQTPDGFVITEFMPNVPWAGKDNTINCAAGLHIAEGRWLRDPKYINDYLAFWLHKGGALRSYSFWIADAAWDYYLVTGDAAFAKSLLPDLVANYREWEKTHLDPNGLYWQEDALDGMEMSIGGSGYRATINSYMYGDAMAISRLAELSGDATLAAEFRDKAARIKKNLQEKLWDKDAAFFKVSPRGEEIKLAQVRELHGYTPWCFDLPDAGYEAAWKQIADPKGFHAPFGLTTAEQRDPHFAVAYTGHECQWNGPSWPFATSMALRAMANLLNDYHQDVVTKQDYFDQLGIYTRAQHLKRDDGKIVPWIDEDLNPFTGDWIAHTLLAQRQQPPPLRGKDYNHSTYADLIITGLIGLRPRADDTVEINPLLPDGAWNYFCLDHIPYHGRTLTILYDKTGSHYNKGVGLQILANGTVIAHAPALGHLTGKLP
jgi:hypothetical protein